jgi:hypothetical protein
MSYVTNVLLSFSVMEDSYETDGEDIYSIMTLVNTWLMERGYGAFGQHVDHVSGGHKHLETPLFAAGFNMFDLGDFLDMLRTLPWKEPSNVQVFVQEQDEDKFRIIEPCVMGDVSSRIR